MQLHRGHREKMEVTPNFDDLAELAERDKKATVLSQESSPTPTRRCIRPQLETSAALSQTPARDSQDTAANYKHLAIYRPPHNIHRLDKARFQKVSRIKTASPDRAEQRIRSQKIAI